MRGILLLGLCAVQGWVQLPVQVKVNTAAATPVHTMRGGLSAGFHVMAAELPGKLAGGGSWSGGDWGGNPGVDDDRHWQEVIKHAEWLG